MKKIITILIFMIPGIVMSQEWIVPNDVPVNNLDYAYSMAVDGSGNVYVTGESRGLVGGLDFATIKYNTAGAQEWVVRFNGSANGDDVGRAIAVDGSGNVYVTGISHGSGTRLDYATIKYNSAGVEQWVARYNGPGNGDDVARSIAVDGSGNVYVTGYSWGGLVTHYDWATIKYNSSGVEQWASRYDGLGSHGDSAFAIFVDGSGNVYVTGDSRGVLSGSDYTTIKYNRSGVEQWVARYNGPGDDLERAQAMAVEGMGAAFVP